MPIRISGSTGISGLDGSATTPVLQGASANSGIYYSGNTVFVSTSGTNAMTIGPTGNVSFANSSVSIGGQTISVYSGMMKNRIINGDMRIDQRFVGAANNNVTGTQYVIDRWYQYGFLGGRFRSQQNNTNGPGSTATQSATGFINYFGANTVVANSSYNAADFYYIAQAIEGLNIVDLNWGTALASPITVSFWVYSSIPGTHAGCVCNSSGARTYPFTYSISAANTWQQQIITIPGDTTGSWFSNNLIGMYVIYNLGVGSNYTSSSGNSWQSSYYQSVTGAVNPQSSANGSFYLTGVQLEKGSQATPFEFRQYTTELSLCQRYFQKSYNPDISVGTATSTGNSGYIEWNWGAMTSYGTVTMFLKQTMRDSPTFTTYRIGDGTINGFAYWNGSTTIQATGTLSGFGRGANIVTWFMDGTSRSNMQFHWTASAELGAQN